MTECKYREIVSVHITMWQSPGSFLYSFLCNGLAVLFEVDQPGIFVIFSNPMLRTDVTPSDNQVKNKLE